MSELDDMVGLVSITQLQEKGVRGEGGGERGTLTKFLLGEE